MSGGHPKLPTRRHQWEREFITPRALALMKIRELRALLASVPGENEIVFSSDEELNLLYPSAQIAELEGEQRYVLYPLGDAEA